MPYYPDSLFEALFGSFDDENPSRDDLRMQLEHLSHEQMEKAILDSLFGFGASDDIVAPVRLEQTPQTPAPTDELARLRAENAKLTRLLKERDADYERVKKKFGTQVEYTKVANSRLRECKALRASDQQALKSERENTATLRTELATSKQELAQRELELRSLASRIEAQSAKLANLQRSVDEKDATITNLRQQYRELSASHTSLSQEHEQLLRDLEAETNAYTERKKDALKAEVRSALATWNQQCQSLNPALVDHEQAQKTNSISNEMRDAMVTSTMAFQKDLAELREAMESLDATRNALRKELDVWQQRLYAVRYDRLALCLQLLDTEVWRTMEAHLTSAVADTDSSSAAGAESALIDTLQILAQNIKGACEGFGLTFFNPQPGEPFDDIRHQAFDAQSGRVVSACVASGVEAQIGDGSRALIRPAIVTLQEG